MAAAWRKHRVWVTVLVIGGAVAFYLTRRPIDAASPEKPQPAAKAGSATALKVTAMHPASGGVPRKTTLPCAAHWHQSADLYSKVSGYLEEQVVDIGAMVTSGQQLATIGVPELERDVQLSTAAHQQSLSEVMQAEARKKTAQADQRAAEAAAERAAVDVERWEAERTFREKEYKRFTELSKASSVQGALVDEKLYQLQAVEAGKRSAESAVQSAREQALAAAAKVELAEAEHGVAKAKAAVAEASLAKAQLMVSFSNITSPCAGVVTARYYHPGDFVRDAQSGGNDPLFTVARTDLIRVVVYIPDNDVPFAHPGDAVRVTFDSLPGRTFAAKLDRIAYSEDPKTRTMRAEVDLQNADNLIVDQMYGRMEIDLEPASNTLTLPSACLVGDLKGGQAQVYVVRDGLAKLQKVSVGPDDGIQVEVLSGLSAGDAVIVSPPANLTDGVSVAAEIAPFSGS